ncbi:outer membrane protein transport protein [bacterium]|nr:outer membrane protein transport protein [bacterium]
MSYKRLFSGIVVIFIAVMVGSVFASNGTQIGTVGARPTAMGSNFRGLADDWTAFHYNPAGLTQLTNKWTIGVSLGMIMPRGSYMPYAFPATVAPFPGLSTDKATLVEQNFAVPSLAIFYKPSEKLTVGLGVAGPFGLGAKFDLIEIPTAYGNDTPLTNTEETTSDHQVVNIQPTIALKLSDKISVGVGIGYIGLLKSPKLASTYMKLNQIAVPEFGAVIQDKSPANYPYYLQFVGFLQQLGLYQPIHSRLILENNMDGKEGTAWNISLGTHIKVNESLSLGVSGRYYTNLKLKGTMNRKVHFPGGTFNASAIAGVFAYLPGAQTVDSLTAIATLPYVRQVFTGTTTDTTYDAEADLPLPLTVGAGIAYKPVPKLTLVADVSWTRWSTWETIDINLTNQTTGEQESISMKENWKNTYEYGAGAEYCLLEQEDMKLNLRGGFYMVDTPSPHSTISPTILDPKNRTVLTGGLGLSLGKIEFAVAYERVMLGKATVPDYVFDDESWGVNDNWAGVYELNANVITFETTIGL